MPGILFGTEQDCLCGIRVLAPCLDKETDPSCDSSINLSLIIIIITITKWSRVPGKQPAQSKVSFLSPKGFFFFKFLFLPEVQNSRRSREYIRDKEVEAPPLILCTQPSLSEPIPSASFPKAASGTWSTEFFRMTCLQAWL